MKLKVPAKAYLDRMGAGHEEYWFRCPGCEMDHRIIVRWGEKANRDKPEWSFNGDFSRPTFSPSLLVSWQTQAEGKRVCHSFIKDGYFQFLSECTHKLAGQIIEMATVEEGL